MPSCRKCRKQLVWPQPYKKGDKPVEVGGNKHICPATYRSQSSVCNMCIGGKVKGTIKEIRHHKRIYHPNNEVYTLQEWEHIFLNKYHKKSKKKDLY